MKRIPFIFLSFLYSCANIQAPTGGIQDTAPPKLEASNPADRALNFKEKDITLTFDEPVELNNLQQQLQITPSIETPYKVKLHKKQVVLHFDEDLAPNTTYTFNFRNSIQDITERNKTQNLVLSFSTGPYMDSIRFNGKVLNLKTNQPIENATVELYTEKDTAGINNHKPMYFIQTDKNGDFEFRNLKNSVYNVFAITDNNKDLMYQEGEKIGWLKKIALTKNTSGIKLLLFQEDTKAPQLLGISANDKRVEIRFNEGVVIQKLVLNADSTQPAYYSVKEDGKSVYLYNSKNIYDSIPLAISVKDSSGNSILKKMNVAFDKKNKSKDILQYKIEPADRKLETRIIAIKFIFSKPIKTFNRKTLILDADTAKLSMADSNYTWNNSRTELGIQRKIKKADTVSLFTIKGTFITADNDSLPEQKILFTISKEEDYGIIHGMVDTKESNYIIELSDAKNNVVQKFNNPKKLNLTHVKPGEYSLRAIIDSNKNGKWDPGNTAKNIDPEKIIYYKDKIQLRANWEIENIVFKF